MTVENPFKYFKTSSKIIRLAVMYYVRYPLSFRQVEDILHERGIDISHVQMLPIFLVINWKMHHIWDVLLQSQINEQIEKYCVI